MAHLQDIANEIQLCKMKTLTKECKRKDCLHCPVNEYTTKQINKLSEEELLALKCITTKKMQDVKLWYKDYSKDRRFVKIVSAVLILIILFCVRGLYKCFASGWSYTRDQPIRQVLMLTEHKVYDRDGDGEINCIDYTLTFKKEWDKRYPSSHCEIVRNYRQGWFSQMNHLFIRVKLDSFGPWIYIEPQPHYYNNNYIMSDIWGSRYKPYYNCYDETGYWLSECKR